MWKKGFLGRGKENPRIGIGEPVLIETSYDTRNLSSRSKHRPLIEAANEAAASFRPPQLAPLDLQEDHSHLDPRYSHAASSYYSQPSPAVPYEHWPPTNALGFTMPFDVSPVEEIPGSYEADRRNSDVSAHHEEEPRSRFSWSTRATQQTTPQTAFEHSPPPSPPPALPAKYNTGNGPFGPRDQQPPQSSHYPPRFDSRPAMSMRSMSSTTTTNTIATMRKPVPTPSYSNTITTAKRSQTQPTQTGPTTNTANYNPYSYTTYPHTPTSSKPSTPTPRACTPTDANKTLPLPPQLADSDSIANADPLSKYTAQLDDLALRRANINRVVKDLTTLPDLNNPLSVDIATRRANERKVKAMQDELAEIAAQEHEIGMKLHRARKKAEREEGYDGGTTALWVRRVTNPV
ncbi:uncharacterized protein BKCO1_1000591 [Diplodia corticola]|uniref:Uncharacterized protein n=1 Tax=Diplodia corticola TaxID=236234 RepID=A0A1J9SJC2_9PEZI|nr:uncharacterized protein BKCO1_1000591 [Diplodia corticola]OJD40447.1 hypothetical protein BKCO1_1000591 [Diplodia corticola]